MTKVPDYRQHRIHRHPQDCACECPPEMIEYMLIDQIAEGAIRRILQ